MNTTEGGLSGSYVVDFKLDDVSVTLMLADVIAIAYGDDIIVAGGRNRTTFRGLAYFNRTQAVNGKSSVGLNVIVGILFCASFVLAPIGLWFMYCAYRNHRAHAVIQAAVMCR
ncbi:hypothetical protein [Paraburkholderia bryophila]|uniref:Uncharacterized protein n=2 Tax=Paraburkholderia TaxID=1822464 RepID=A0A7Y9WLI6_9BURK|nr:hypothetical protein [Paraburkholderia bryophila]NYH23159.1 hypothetical protein [Paraburkholderia bryophila]